ncbi:hypothetical protein L596_005212 [Steinernema carpocapsae]|uniref:Membrane-associated tyrosine- and threonine-specific cdc2-inhibitory kinase wee-1.3 n=1 Tax=Steinernema carpocapsae TaxID=34508 RepID=A0A4U8V2I3_STECR|nr:hypothetical protein L596_005212 [Steinernema carpocapsae]
MTPLCLAIDMGIQSAGTPRPVPVFYHNSPPLSTKRERIRNTPADRNPASIRRLALTTPSVSRFRQRSELRTRRPVFISYFNKKTDVLAHSRSYDFTSSDTYFDQCFTVQKQLGEGSFGEVFSVVCKDDMKPYAIKRSIEPYKSLVDRETKLREVEKHQALSRHPNLVHFVRAWEERGFFYIQTELCDRSLDQYIVDTPDCTVSEPKLWGLFFDMLQGIEFLHSRDFIHVDIKPDNIFLTTDGHCKLGDFGLMIDLKKDKIVLAEEGDSKYLAAEVLNGVPSKSSDIFSLGVTILEVASGLDLPSHGKGWTMIRNKNIPDHFLKGLSPELVHIINQMIDPNPDARPTARDLLKHRRFKHLNLNLEIEPEPETPTECKRIFSSSSPPPFTFSVSNPKVITTRCGETVPAEFSGRARTRFSMKKVGKLDFSKIE